MSAEWGDGRSRQKSEMGHVEGLGKVKHDHNVNDATAAKELGHAIIHQEQLIHGGVASTKSKLVVGQDAVVLQVPCEMMGDNALQTLTSY